MDYLEANIGVWQPRRDEQVALAQQFDLRFPVVRAAGERVPLCDGSCDLVISEYGASYDPFVTAEWARRWPCEEVWCARRR